MKLQSEVKEWVLTPEGELVQVAAKKPHSQMSDDKVTDDLPEGSYIFSNAPKMKLNKKDFDDLIVATKSPEYKEGKKPDEVKEIKFSDEYFSKSKNTPAEIVKNIQKKHPLILDDDQKHNPFVQKANEFNRVERLKPLGTIMAVSEMIREPNEHEIPNFKNGGNVGYSIKDNNTPKYFWGAVIAGAVQLGTHLISNGVAKNKAKKAGAKRAQELEELTNQRQANLDQSNQVANLTSLAKTAIPNPEYNYADYAESKSRTNATFDKIFADYDTRKNNILASSQAPANSIVRNAGALGLSPMQTSNLVADTQGKAINDYNSKGAEMDFQKDDLHLKRMSNLNRYSDAETTDLQQGLNFTDQNRYAKSINSVNEFGTNQQNYLTGKDQLMVDKYTGQYLNSMSTLQDGYNRAAMYNATFQPLAQAVGNTLGEAVDNRILENRANKANSDGSGAALIPKGKWDISNYTLTKPSYMTTEAPKDINGRPTFTMHTEDVLVDKKTGLKYTRNANGDLILAP